MPDQNPSLEHILDESLDEDILKKDVVVPRKGITLDFEPNQGQPVFFIETDFVGSGVEDESLYVTDFSYRQVWAELFSFPVSGVARGRNGFLLSPELIKQISDERAATLNKRTVKLLLKGKDTVFLRGVLPEARATVSNSKLLDSMVAAYDDVDAFVPFVKKEDHLLQLVVTEEDSVITASVAGGDRLYKLQQAVAVVNSEVGAAKASVAPAVHLPDYHATIAIPRGTEFTVGSTHTDKDNLVHDISSVLRGRMSANDLKDLFKKAAGKTVGSPQQAAGIFQKRFNASNRTKDYVIGELERGQKEGTLYTDSLSLAIAVARIAQRETVEHKRVHMYMAGKILVG